MGRCVARSLRPSIRQKFHRRFNGEFDSRGTEKLNNRTCNRFIFLTSIYISLSPPIKFSLFKPPDGELWQVCSQALTKSIDNLERRLITSVLWPNLSNSPWNFFCGDDGSKFKTFRKNGRKIIFVWGCPLGAFFNCDFAPVFSPSKFRAGKLWITTYWVK